MVADAWLLGVAILLTLLAGGALSGYESWATRRGLSFRRFERPGATALIIGFSLAALVTGRVGQSWFVLPAAAFAALSTTSVFRRGGRVQSFVLLWLMAAVVVLDLNAQIPAYGNRAADVALTGLLLACFTSVIRELDLVGSAGWFAALATSIGTAVAALALHHGKDAGVALLVAGAVFAVVAVTPFGSAMLGRMGSRLAGLVIGALAIRTVVGSPVAMTVVVAVGLVAVIAYVVTLEAPGRGRVALGVVALGALMGVAALPAVAALLHDYGPVHRSVKASRRLVRADAVRIAGTGSELASLHTTFAAAAARLDKPAVKFGRAVPFLSVNLHAATSSAHVAADMTASARQLINAVNLNAAAVHHATVSRAGLTGLNTDLVRVQTVVHRASARIGGGENEELLEPELRTGVAELRTQLLAVERRIATSVQATTVAEKLLGYDRQRRYFVAVQNNAESRATGGYIANYGILVADKGHVSLPEFRRTSDFDAPGAPPRQLHAAKDYLKRYSQFDVNREWTNVNMSPDLPTVAAVIADQYRQFSGTRVDGVIAVDPIALAQLLKLTGPVQVPGWPTPIAESNVVPITLHDEYIAYDNQVDNRIDFIGRVAKVVFDRLSDGGLGDLVRAGGAVHTATSTRHLQFWAADASVERFFTATHTAGAVPQHAGDTLMLTTQNAAGNKLDYYLHRGLSYDATVRRDGDHLRVDATATVTLRNAAPDSGQPRYVIGPYDQRFVAGQNRLFVTIYSPLSVTQATLDGKPLELSGAPELGLLAESAFVDVPAGATRTITLRMTGTVTGRSRYTLALPRQPVIYDDGLSLRLHGLATKPMTQTVPFRRDLHLEFALSAS